MGIKMLNVEQKGFVNVVLKKCFLFFFFSLFRFENRLKYFHTQNPFSRNVHCKKLTVCSSIRFEIIRNNIKIKYRIIHNCCNKTRRQCNAFFASSVFVFVCYFHSFFSISLFIHILII